MTIPLLADDPHDAALRANVHPPDWANPTPAPSYNLVVIGAGTAGLVSAAGAAGLGARVALIERDLLGGDCLNVGCVPSKALLASARVAVALRDAAAFGVRVPSGPEVDFPAVMARLRRLRAGLSPNDSAQRFRGLGVDVFLGDGRFTGPNTVAVAGQTLHFRRAVIATGARARRPDVPGLAEVGFLTNENVFSLTALPARLAVLGAGPICCELSQAFARLGSRVSLIDHHERTLSREDHEASRRVEASLRRDGVEMLLARRVESVERRGVEKVLRLNLPPGELVVDEVLVGVGRAPNVEGLGLEAAGVAYDAQVGVTVDDHLRTSNPSIYAAGDVCSRFQFTHVADAMARIVLQNALFLGRARVSKLVIPHCTYTDPELGQVGLSEEAAAAQGIKVNVFVQELRGVDRAVLDGEPEGLVKVLVRAGTDRVVGATVVAAHAGEMLPLLTLAVEGKVRLGQLARTIFPYPTQSEAVKKIADAFNRTRLTPWVKWAFAKWLAWRR